MKRDIFGRFAPKLSRYQKGCVIGMAILATLPVMDKVQKWMTAPELIAQNTFGAPAFAAEITPSTIEEAKNKVIEQLEKCEGAGHTWDEGYFKMDTNNKYSYSPLQWQEDTVKTYVVRRDGKKLSGVQAKTLALTRDVSEALAKYVIFETSAGVDTDWVICARNYNLQPQVDLIKSLMKEHD